MSEREQAVMRALAQATYDIQQRYGGPIRIALVPDHGLAVGQVRALARRWEENLEGLGLMARRQCETSGE